MADWKREQRLTSFVDTAGFSKTSVFINDLPDRAGPEGTHNYTCMGSATTVDIFVASWLSDPDAEATALHELAHVELGHDDDPGYAAALASDDAAGTDRHRGPWEIDADSFAAALIESVADVASDARRSLVCLAEDAARFG